VRSQFHPHQADGAVTVGFNDCLRHTFAVLDASRPPVGEGEPPGAGECGWTVVPLGISRSVLASRMHSTSLSCQHLMPMQPSLDGGMGTAVSHGHRPILLL